MLRGIQARGTRRPLIGLSEVGEPSGMEKIPITSPISDNNVIDTDVQRATEEAVLDLLFWA